MMLKNVSIALAGAAMIAVPSLAAAAPVATANPASSLSLSHSARVGATTTNSNKITRKGTIIAGVLALGIVAGGIILIADDNNDNPSSR